MNGKFNSTSKQIQDYESIIDQANDAMLVIDSVNGRIRKVNPNAAHLLRYSEKELMKELLFTAHNINMDKQKENLYIALRNWEGELLQVNDILIIGIKI